MLLLLTSNILVISLEVIGKSSDVIFNLSSRLAMIQTQDSAEDLLNLQAEQIEKLKMWIVAFLIVAFLIIVVMSFIMQSNRMLRRQNATIRSQQEEIAHINNNLAIQVDNLRQMNSEKNSVISYVSHDLITPLGNIEGLVNLVLLNKEKLSDEQVEYLSKMLEVVKNGKETIQSMLNINKIEQEIKGIDLLEHNVVALVDEVIMGHEFLMKEKQVEVKRKHSKDSITLKTDKQYFKQIVGNILIYAVKNTPGGKEVSISTDIIVNTIRIKIKDQGEGLSEKDKERLFLKYSQPRNDSDPHGLALAIAKQLIDKLNAKIRVESSPGEGTEFTLEFLQH